MTDTCNSKGQWQVCHSDGTVFWLSCECRDKWETIKPYTPMELGVAYDKSDISRGRFFCSADCKLQYEDNMWNGLSLKRQVDKFAIEQGIDNDFDETSF